MSNEDWHVQETYKSLMLYGNNAVKFVVLINGGSVIALLTFLGNFVTSGSRSVDMVWPMSCFLAGIVIGGAANLTAYFTQLSIYNESIGNDLKIHHTAWLFWTLGLVIVSILLFGIGAVLALLEIGSYT